MRLGNFEMIGQPTRVIQANVHLETTPHVGIMLHEPGTLVVMRPESEEPETLHNVPAGTLVAGPFAHLVSPTSALLVLK